MELQEIEKLAEIQKNLIEVAIEEKMNCDVIIKIRNGKIIFSESKPTDKKRLIFRTIKIVAQEI